MKVTNEEKNEKIATKAKDILGSKPLIAICAVIIAGNLAYPSISKLVTAKEDNKANPKPVSEETMVEATPTPTPEITPEPTAYAYTINYSNAESFYNEILNNRNTYGQDFASSFQSIDDVKSFITFVTKFDELYSYDENQTNINSLEQFQEIIANYYSSCVKYNVTPNLSSILNNYPYGAQKVSETEQIAKTLINGSGNDFTIVNNYFKWYSDNLCNGQISTTSIKNAPIVVILNEEYKQYRNQGNMASARIIELPKDVDGNICPNTIDKVMLNEIDYTNDASGMFDIVYDTIESKCNTYKLERK